MKKSNYATLQHKGESFSIWQDENANWHFSYLDLLDVNTQHKELQTALNEAHSSVQDKMPRRVTTVVARAPQKTVRRR